MSSSSSMASSCQVSSSAREHASPDAGGWDSARGASGRLAALLHLVEHLAEGVLDLQGLLDLVGRDVRILAILQEAGALVLPDELDERRGVRLPVHRKPFEVLEDRVDTGQPEERD